MYHWTDADVGVIIGLVARSFCSAECDDESLNQLLQELKKFLNAKAWVFETGIRATRSEWIAPRHLVCPDPTLSHSRLGGSNLGCYEYYRRLWANSSSLDPQTPCMVVATQCECRGQDSMHPVIACFWSNASKQTRCLEYCRGVGETAFSERDQAVLRVLARQLEQVAVGLDEPKTKDHPAQDLSPRQREVLSLLLLGKNCKQIAFDLRLSAYTVNDYIKAIYRRYDVSCRAELLAAVHFGPRDNKDTPAKSQIA
jgi:DNA-binding NarL/FixJ family response regulator